MTLTKKTYRCLVLISILSFFVAITFRGIYWGNFDKDIQTLLNVDGYGSVIPFANFFGWATLSIVIIYYTGLLLFKIWAVWLLLILNVFLLLLSPFHGVSVETPLESILGNIGMLIDGVLISTAFYSDIKHEFN